MNLHELKKIVLRETAESFARVDEISERNTSKVLDAMRQLKISDAHFKTSTGYAYGDIGREKLDELFAQIFLPKPHLSARNLFRARTHWRRLYLEFCVRMTNLFR